MKEIVLKARQYHVTFKLLDIFNEKDYPYIKFLISIKTFPNNIELAKNDIIFLFTDIISIINYFENHIEKLKLDPFYESYVFVTNDLYYNIQASCGDLSCEKPYFDLRFMLNINDWENRVYVGCQGEIDLDEIKKFLNESRKLIE